MRKFQIYIVLFLIGLGLTCKKEHSREGSSLPERSWEFSESEQLFGGPVDSAFIESAGDGESLTIFGSSDDSKDGKLYLRIVAEEISTGIFHGADVQVRYQTESELFDTGELSGIRITVIKIEGEIISGIFSGTLKDSQGETRTISEGKFHCSFIRKASSKRTLTVWTKQMCGGNNLLQIRIKDSSQFITTALNSQPSCSGFGSVSFSLVAGNYSVEVICGDTLKYDIAVNDECTYLEVGPNNDYLPLGTGSSWEYADVKNENTTLVFTAIGDFDLNGTVYTQLIGTRGEAYYFRKSAHSYFQYRELGFQDFISDAPFVELIILKDNLSVGQTWETESIDVSVSEVVQKIKMVSTIINRDYSDIIHGEQYDNLIKVNTEIYFSPDGGNSFASSGSAYNTVFAKGKGIVSYNDFNVAIEWGIKNIYLGP